MRFASIQTEKGSFLCPEPLVEISNPSLFSIKHSTMLTTPSINPSFSLDSNLQTYLSGRHLLIDELPFPIDQLHSHYLNGSILYEKGILLNKNRYCCQRCGNDDQTLFASFSCFRCKEEQCTYCRKCIIMGRVSECTPLIRWVGPARDKELSAGLAWDGTLSELQKEASQRICEAVGEPKEMLVWAVCGAGKTEILFEGIERALRLGLRVCLASPRTDVITELYPRFEKAFPKAGVAALYGGHSELTSPSSLVLSTTHQLFRFKNAFDVIVVDEVDAFPFSYDRTLKFAVDKAAVDQSTRIYLSATPSNKMKQRVRSQNLEVIHISKRFHGYPLPVPHYKWCGNWSKLLKKQRIPSVIRQWIKEKLASGRQAFLFVPTIEQLDTVYSILKENPEIDSVHSSDPDRIEKIKRFRKGEIKMLLTTTILERGVTVPKIDVGVLGSDHDVFSSNALVQIAGRAGRSVEDPYGEVVYFHFGKTSAMVSAKREIQNHNRRAGLVTRR
ncbi:DEAD/DEAH box helicase [Alkalihalobacillus sp. AL-G]|uniref:DEAD/DEAH box helicase n=1 Tax=Alkalihalobacillus sp. AL-G TaxID=2926399 RepID=UPI00272A974A|nr:DEAD/DEAH box helicase [Alkalihalobacillus sp. AL-G]WLD92980.1 DEAD/DEAH box helicase [Alkalihalobacillus sp. AL-G]